MITKNRMGWSAGIVAIALFAAACGGTTSPETVEPATSESAATEDVTSGQVPDATTPAVEATDEATDENGAVDGQDGAETDPPATPAPEALQFVAPLVGGGEIDLAANFDNKPTLFWFWAPN